MTTELPIETLQARREWQDILEVMEKTNKQTNKKNPTAQITVAG